ncbi:GIY-YIG nuclease family protein [Streptomyces sp. NPDC047130]|uniref:GIY-YIG nuclease family protein n=1 Tax=Streptomyces sp. NPDC047130 TaxID=3155261 RepID=UPI0033DEA4DF
MDVTALARPDRLWSVEEVLSSPSPVPAAAGVYGWHFEEPPHPELPGRRLLYVGMAPRRTTTRTSTQNLATRVRYHCRGNAAGSTLRLSLGCLLGLELRRVGSGRRLTFGREGEAELSRWMADNARVCWVEHAEPTALESRLIAELDVPLNIDQNSHNAFYRRLREIRAQARSRARELPVAS